jgi:hypothetical protein
LKLKILHLLICPNPIPQEDLLKKEIESEQHKNHLLKLIV